MRYRQVHLDFHTSEKIRGIGAKFDKGQFQRALQTGCVDSVTLFSKCHHGLSYHPTEVGAVHPGLAFDLLGAQLEACREIDVRAPVYISAGLDEHYVSQNRGHLAMMREGSDPLAVGYHRLCLNTPYLDYLCRQIKEVVEKYAVDGIFLDIVGVVPCVCVTCRRALYARGLDPERAEDVLILAREVQLRYMDRTNAAARARRKSMPVFHNAGHVPKGYQAFVDRCSHLELESLPTGGWGYNHLPLSARYAATQPVAFLGMTGKFHTTWGEFGGFKHPNALRYECAAMLAHGARCSVGDQLHPNGAMNMDTYGRLGAAYAEVKAKEPWCRGARPVSEVAVLSMEALLHHRLTGTQQESRLLQGDQGAGSILMERQVMFDMIDARADFSAYRVILLPDRGRLPPGVAGKLKTFLRGGGALLLSAESGLREDRDAFWFPVGRVEGVSPFDPEYIRVRRELLRDDREGRLVRSPFVLPGRSLQVKPAAGAVVLADLYEPYFNRTLEHFSSHQHAPEAKKSRYPAAWICAGGRIAYVAPAVFGAYAERGQMLYRDLVYLVLRRLLKAFPSTVTTLPSAGRATLMEQPARERYVLHLLYASPIRRGGGSTGFPGLSHVEVIEDIVPMADVACRVRTPRPVTEAALVPQGRKLELTRDGDAVTFVVPRLACHQMIELRWK